MDLDGFENLWEHVRLLSDAPRNEQLISLLRRHAPGKVVAEVGCGTGLLSIVAAKLGAEHVYAIEPTLQWQAAAALVQANGLTDRVTVLPGRIQDLERRPVDLAFSELLNAEPLAEEVCDAMDAAAEWVKPGGRLAPRRLKIWAALVRTAESALEVRNASAEMRSMEERFGLDLSPLLADVTTLPPYAYLSPMVRRCSPGVLLADIALGTGARPTDGQARLLPDEPGLVGGAVVWFEAEYDDDIVMNNAPGNPGHWGHLVCSWPTERGVPIGGGVDVQYSFEDDECRIWPI